jgi:hypothetical protein
MTKEGDLRQLDVGRPCAQQTDELFHFGVLHRAIGGILFPNVDIGEIVLEVRPDDAWQSRDYVHLPVRSKLPG